MTRNKERRWVGTDNLASATGLPRTTHHEHNAHSELPHCGPQRAKRVATSQHRTSAPSTSHPKDGPAVNSHIPHNRRTPPQAEEALGPIAIPRGLPLLED